MNQSDKLLLSNLSEDTALETPVPKRLDENTLVHYLQSHTEKTFSRLYDAYAPALYGVILRIVKQPVISQDVLQEVFVKIWNTHEQYDSTKGRLFTWLLNIARNQAIDKTRSRSYLEGLKTSALVATIFYQKPVTLRFQPEHIGIKELITKLSSEHKTIIDLMYFEGYTQSEIAERLHIPLGTVKTRTRKALQVLRTLL